MQPSPPVSRHIFGSDVSLERETMAFVATTRVSAVK